MQRLLIALILGAVMVSTGLFADTADLATQGYWKSIGDGKTDAGKVTALWKLSLDKEGHLQGIIVWAPGKPADEKYISKKAEFNGLPMRGTIWMKGLKKNGNDGWNNGTIVDVGGAAGDVYGCEVKILEGGKKLAMRGYIGISLIGRTQTWVHADDAEAKTLMGN